MEKGKVKFISEKCLSCKTCELACALAHVNLSSINEALLTRRSLVPRLKIALENSKLKLLRCMQCKKPKCIEACESKALYLEQGLVHLNEQKCTGCWKCVELCKFKAIFKDELLGIAVKCDLCKGKDGYVCVTTCLT
jgi:carbon-monoxide dehydrogenase iron sulfur subunit